MATVALLGDVMLGRGVGEVLRTDGPEALFSTELRAVLSEADAVVANLECCISPRGARWPNPEKPFFFRAPPVATDALALLGVSAVTLANNHALDYGYDALADTLELLHEAGIATTGAGATVDAARSPATVVAGGVTVRVIGCTDHPAEFAATHDRAGVAYTSLAGELDPWLTTSIRAGREHAVLVTPHWGPNMVREPLRRVRRAAAALVDAGASLVAGHSAHVFHGVAGRVLFDLGDFIDDYAVDPALRNDLGLVFLVEISQGGPGRLQAVPIALDYCHTRLARPVEATWVRDRFTAACSALGTTVEHHDDRIVVDLGTRTSSGRTDTG